MNIILLVLAVSLPPAARAAEAPEAKGLRIFREMEKRDDGFVDTRETLRMILRNRGGDESVRRMRMKTLEVQGDGDKSVIVFDNPRDVKGTALLTYSHRKKSDDQWLYLPALKRVKRISSSNKSGSFMGSEFTYEDFGSREVEKYTYKWLRDEPCPGELGKLTCHVVESYPTDRKSGYTKIVNWVDSEEFRQVKGEFHDRKRSHLKTLTSTGFEKHLKRFWRPMRMEMINHQSGKSTELKWDSYKFRTGLKKSDFSRNALKRVR